jgi:hypothetical protein
MSPSAGRRGTADTIHLNDQHFDEAGGRKPTFETLRK